MVRPFDSPGQESVNKAFSSQSFVFDEEDFANPVLQEMRKQVYAHVDKLIKPQSRILELNAGTGIDAVRFAGRGHSVHATDLSDGMVHQIKDKISRYSLHDRLTCQQISFEEIDHVEQSGFDYVFSNFGGLNCSADLGNVTRHLPRLLQPGAIVTWVIMPRVCLWEIAGFFKGNFKNAFRRFHRNGVIAHLEGHYFRTYYHSLTDISKAFGSSFELVACEGLACLTAPPYAARFAVNHRTLTNFLRAMDKRLRKQFPFNRWGDHIIVSFKYKGNG